MTTITQSIDTLPTAPDPAVDSPTAFSTKAAASVLAQKAMVPQLNTWAGQVNTVAGEVNTNATTASAAATSATASATAATAGVNAVAWVNGATYAQYSAAISTLDFQTYRKITASSVTITDPKNDPTNWVKLTGGPPAWITKTATYNPVAGGNDRVNVDTQTIGAFSIPLPASPSDGDTFEIIDSKKYFDTNNFTLQGNGKTIEGYTNLICNVRGMHKTFKYDATNTNWRM